MKNLIRFSVGICIVLGTQAWAGSAASFLCLRGSLLSSHTNVNGRFDDRHGSSGRGVDFGTQEYCLNSLNYSNEGFICNGRTLIASGRGALSDAASVQECWTSVAQAKNGFACLGTTLFNAENGYIAITENNRECLDAVAASK